MGSFRPRTSNDAGGSAILIGKELSLAADLSLWAGDQNKCVTVIARIYDLFDDLEQGLAPDWRGQAVAADTAAWVGDKDRCVALISDALA